MEKNKVIALELERPTPIVWDGTRLELLLPMGLTKIHLSEASSEKPKPEAKSLMLAPPKLICLADVGGCGYRTDGYKSLMVHAGRIGHSRRVKAALRRIYKKS